MNIRERQSPIKIGKNKTYARAFNSRTVATVLTTVIVALALVFGAQAVQMFDRADGGDLIKVPGDYPTIQSAINAAGAGDIIQVRAGVYNENLTVNKAVSLVAESYDVIDPVKNNTVIDGGGRPTTIRIPAGLTQMPVIRGFVIRNGSDGILSYSEFISEFNYFHSAENLTSYQKGAGGINRNNVYFGAANNAIRLDNMDRPLLIENNRIMYSGADGIEISLQSPTAPRAVVEVNILNNMILGNSEDGIQFIDHPGNPQDTNRRFVIVGNLIANNRRAGVGFMPNANTIEDFSSANLAEAVRVFNNTFYGNDYGISGGGNLATFNNIIANSLGRGTWRIQGPPASNAVVAYSLFHNNKVDADQSVLGAGVITGVDPLFEAAPNSGPDGTWATVDDDFSGLILRPDSPAIDKGVTQYTATNGELIPPSPMTGYVGAAPDLGWREVGAPIFTIPTSISSLTPLPTETPMTPSPSPAITSTAASPTPLTFTATPETPTPAIPSETPTTVASSPTATVAVTQTPQLTIQSIDPISMQANATAMLTITGAGFQSGAVVTFEGGEGQAPVVVSAPVVVNSTTIIIMIDSGSSGESAPQVWDVRVTNPDGSIAVLLDAFTVTPPASS